MLLLRRGALKPNPVSGIQYNLESILWYFILQQCQQLVDKKEPEMLAFWRFFHNKRLAGSFRFVLKVIKKGYQYIPINDHVNAFMTAVVFSQ